MLVFLFSLFCAGAILSSFARFPLLVLVTMLTAIATSLAVAFDFIEKDLIGSSLGAFFLPMIALQMGYGVGVIAIAWFHGALRSRRPIESGRQTADSSSAKARTQIDSSSGI